jgi:hypothetical protein
MLLLFAVSEATWERAIDRGEETLQRTTKVGGKDELWPNVWRYMTSAHCRSRCSWGGATIKIMVILSPLRLADCNLFSIRPPLDDDHIVEHGTGHSYVYPSHRFLSFSGLYSSNRWPKTVRANACRVADWPRILMKIFTLSRFGGNLGLEVKQNWRWNKVQSNKGFRHNSALIKNEMIDRQTREEGL